jgi:Lipid A 3-O-deacylase (PagL)
MLSRGTVLHESSAPGRWIRRGTLCLAALWTASLPAHADGLCGLFAPADRGPFVNEIRVALVAHDASPIDTQRPERGTSDVNAEVRFRPYRWLLGVLCAPRPNLGVSINTDGLTSQAFGGFTWTVEPRRWFFVDVDLGLAVHNGKLLDPSGERISLGSRLLLRAAAEPGVRFGPDRRLSLSGFWDHVSNGRILGGRRNQGIDTMGVRFGYAIR